MPDLAQLYALPKELRDEGITRYGFHGLSNEYIIYNLKKVVGKDVANGRVIIAHLGNGASMVATSRGRSVDTTIGFTPTGGLMMSTRSGDLDPGVILYLLRQKNLSPSEVADIVNKQAGLLGISKISPDMKELLEMKKNADTAEAVNLFCYQARKFLGSLAAVLGGIDTLVFTGGIGENSPPIGHWGTSPGLNFIYVHLNRIITARDLNVIFICGPGHGGPAMLANTYLEGTYSERYPDITQDASGMSKLFRQFSFPGGVPSQAAPETPGPINEGGELGYSLSHAFGAAFDNPDLIVTCVIGDGEAETGPLATAWHSNKFLNPVYDGAVLPIIHLNGYKIANPTILGHVNKDELENLFAGYGYKPYFVEGSEPQAMHQLMADTLDTVIAEIKKIQKEARDTGKATRPRWPMIIFRSPKGWTGPKKVDLVFFTLESIFSK
jgi:transketolase N-terminal domain/subunit